MTPPQSEALGAPPGDRPPTAGSSSTSTFDFRHPAPLNETRLEAVVATHRRWADTLSAIWADVLPEDVTVELSDAGRVSVATLAAEDAPPCHATVIPTERRDAPIVVVVPVELAHVMVDRVLGGPGELMAELRPVTEIESRLIAGPIEGACASLAHLYQLAPATHYETTGDLASLHLDATGASVLRIEIGVTLGGRTLPVAVVVTAGSVGPVTDVLADVALVEDHATDPESRRRAVARMVEVPVDVEVRFFPSTIRSSEILSVKVGDVVALGTPSGGLLDLVIDGLRVALVRPARNGAGLACQVVAALDTPEPVLAPVSDPRPSRTRSGAS